MEAPKAVGLAPADHAQHDYVAIFSKIVGSTLGGLRLAPRKTRRPSALYRPCYAERQKTLDVIAGAVRIHNEARGGPSVFSTFPEADKRLFFSIGAKTRDLSRPLRWIERMPQELRHTDAPGGDAGEWAHHDNRLPSDIYI
jgi:hypothetical protein